MSRASRSSIVANPVLVGTVTLLVTLIAVFLAYNANTGLPFVPSYHVRVVLPDASELGKGNDVRIAGTRVGAVSRVGADPGPRGVPRAVIDVTLERSVGPLARDTRALVRQRSTLGLKYLELRPGHARATVPDHGTLHPPRAVPAVDLDDVLNVFDRETRVAARGAVGSLGDGLAARGPDLNRAFGDFAPLAQRFTAVGRTLAAPGTRLGATVRALAAAATAVAPVAEPLAGLIDSGARTFGAIASERGALGRALSEAPGFEASGTAALRAMRPALSDTAALVRSAAPAVPLLAPTSRRLAAALEAGTPVLARTPPVADRLAAALGTLAAVVRDPHTDGAVRELSLVVASVRRTLAFVNPFQTRCNYLALWGRNASSVVSEGDTLGTWFRFVNIVQPDEALPRATPAPDLHVMTYPDAGQNGECEPGNAAWVPGQHIGTVPGRQPDHTETTSPPPGVRGP
jgi:virulence factor Mce-like protein